MEWLVYKESRTRSTPAFSGRELEDAKFLFENAMDRTRHAAEQAFNLGVLIGIRLREGFPAAHRAELIEKAKEVLRNE